ncbi:hypothetical protein L2E82_35601 [Cichorium intybus]|uniref:Uncharacterized protein n=1 Tax=Cichorium intybus TaxID=13427 RepID=A0ACB9BPA6_CICIN|nr:hypothetical protein L2E82_35601 [Cichorium intybus]
MKDSCLGPPAATSTHRHRPITALLPPVSSSSTKSDNDEKLIQLINRSTSPAAGDLGLPVASPIAASWSLLWKVLNHSN